MAGTVYTYELKTIECTACGAPLTGTIAGARVTCSYCNAVISISPRMKESRPSPMDERQRLLGLRAQADVTGSSSNPLAERTPAGLEQLDPLLDEESARPVVFEAYRRAWREAKERLAAVPSDLELATRLFRIALRLDLLYAESGDHSRARALLETSLDRLPTPEQRDVIRCRLARAAVRLGDLAAFSAWMRDADHRSPRLEVDTEYRCSMALYYLHQRDFPSILTILGKDGADLPLAPQPLVFCLRSHALAGLGREEPAREQIARAAQVWGLGIVRRTWSTTDGPATRFALDAAREAVGVPGLAARPRSERPAATRRASVGSAALIGLLLVGATLLLTRLVPWRALVAGGGQPLELALERARACPAARLALGANVRWAIGSAIEEEVAGGEAWSLPVRGDRVRGTLSFSAVERSRGWSLATAALRTSEGRPLDLMTCEVQLPVARRGSR